MGTGFRVTVGQDRRRLGQGAEECRVACSYRPIVHKAGRCIRGPRHARDDECDLGTHTVILQELLSRSFPQLKRFSSFRHYEEGEQTLYRKSNFCCIMYCSSEWNTGRAMPPGLDALQHIVVLMLENRSFDHMLGCLQTKHPQIDGLNGTKPIPDSTGATVPIQQLAEFRGQLLPDPHHDFASVDYQIFNGDTSPTRTPTMDGFIRIYQKQQQPDVPSSHHVAFTFRGWRQQPARPAYSGNRVRSIHSLVCLNSRAYALQPGICPLWLFLQQRGNERFLYSLAIQEHLRAAYCRGAHIQALLLRRHQLLAGGRKPAAERTGDVRHLPGF